MSAARDAFREAVAQVAAKAKTVLPESHGRIDAAVQLVLAGDVELLGDGSALVGSRSDAARQYSVNGSCTCADFERAPSHLCKHRLAANIEKRALDVVKTLPTPPADQRATATVETSTPRTYDVEPSETPDATVSLAEGKNRGSPDSLAIPGDHPGQALRPPRWLARHGA